MKLFGYFLILSLPFCMFSCSGCGGSSSDENVNAYPESFVVASPLMNTLATASSLDTIAGSKIKINEFKPDASFKEQTKVINAIVNSTTIDNCKISLPTLPQPGNSPRATCYGPVVEYQYHLDSPGNSGIASLPPGDLGLWTSSDGSQACTAAQMNAIINDMSAKVDSSLLLAASMVCIMNANGQSLPSAGSSVSLTTELNDAIQVNNPNTTISTASLERLEDSDGHPVYKYSIISTTLIGTESFTYSTYLKHIPTVDDNSSYKGKIWGSLEPSTSVNATAYSVTYEKENTAIKAKLTSAFSVLTKDSLLDSDGNIPVTGPWNQNFNYALFNIDSETGLGAVSYSWQAGAQDSHTRVFNVFTEQNGDVVSGCGFFGYGQKVDKSGGTLPTNTISTFICNWAGPGNSHVGKVNMAQKQCMEKNASGYFVSTKDNIEYSPVNNCSNTANQSNGAGTFGIRLSGEISFDTSARPNDLVDLTTDTDYANYTAPIAPSDI